VKSIEEACGIWDDVYPTGLNDDEDDEEDDDTEDDEDD